jgi:hypothetical protein
MAGVLTSPVELCIEELLRQKPLREAEIQALTLRDLPEGPNKAALVRHRFVAGQSLCPNSRVLVS